MKRRLVLITEIIAPYRVPVFNALAAREDIDLHVLFLSQTDPSLRAWDVPLNDIHFSYQVLPSLRRRIGRYNLLLNLGLSRALTRSRPEAIICGGYNYVASWQAAYWAKRRGISFLCWVESTAADRRGKYLLIEALKQRFFTFCRAFVVPGKSSTEYLRQFDIPEQKIFQAPNAVDNQLFLEGARKAKADERNLRERLKLPERYFLFVGRLVSAKGVFDLLDAYATLEDGMRSKVGLVFVGDGSARAELERCASKIGSGDVQFVGFVQKEQLAAFYALAESLIFPTHSDTWGFVVNEAMVCGLPIVLTEVAGCAADLVKDGWNGIIFPAHDRAKLAHALQYLILNDDLKMKMGERSMEHIGAYSAESCAAGLARATEAALGGRR